MASTHQHLTALLLILAATAVLPHAAALSWPLCDAGGQVWVTERPRTEPGFPGANLWFFCESGLNVLGVSVDPCVNNGTLCTPAVADALCQAFGFDMAWGQAMGGTPPVLANASLAEPVRSLTGEYCLRRGVYAAELPQDLEALPGEPCTKLDGLTCIRNRKTIITALDHANLAAFKPAPPAAEPAVAPAQKVSQEDQHQLAAASDGGGVRRLHLRRLAL